MPARSGNWQLLDRDSDPVAGDPDKLLDLIRYYTDLAKTISDEAIMLKRIGGGDASQLMGEAADAARSKSTDVAGQLDQASRRYEAARDALRQFAPALDQGRLESMKALTDAEAAHAATISSTNLPDPSVDRPKDAPPLTNEETTEIGNRTNAINRASEELGAAKSRLRAALDVLDEAGRSAASIINDAINHDGLRDTWQYKLRQGWLKFLKVLVKVLTWIGVALAVLAFFIPGLAVLAIAGAVVAGLALIASISLAAMGEGSWLDVILNVVAIAMLGAGAIVAKLVQASHIALLSKITSTAAKTTATQLLKFSKVEAMAKFEQAVVRSDLLAGRLNTSKGLNRLMVLDQVPAKYKITSMANFTAKLQGEAAATFKIKPNWWNVRHPDFLPNDFAKVKDVLLAGDWKWQRLLAVDKMQKLEEMKGVAAKDFAIKSNSTPFWHYTNAGRVVYGYGNNVFKLGANPTGFGDDNSRWDAYQAGRATLTSPKA